MRYTIRLSGGGLGREVFMAPVTFREDGWFTVGKDGTMHESYKTKAVLHGTNITLNQVDSPTFLGIRQRYNQRKE